MRPDFATKLNQKVRIGEKYSKLTFLNSLKRNFLNFLSGVSLKIIIKTVFDHEKVLFQIQILILQKQALMWISFRII